MKRSEHWNKLRNRPKVPLDEVEARRRGRRDMAAYRCGVCDAWHVGRRSKKGPRRDMIWWFEVGGQRARAAVLAENDGRLVDRVAAIVERAL